MIDHQQCIIDRPRLFQRHHDTHAPACRYVSNFLPRAVYTSGKASTAAGLTASVVKVGIHEALSEAGPGTGEEDLEKLRRYHPRHLTYNAPPT